MKLHGAKVDCLGWPVLDADQQITDDMPDETVFILAISSAFDYAKRWQFGLHQIQMRLERILTPALMVLAERQGGGENYDYSRMRDPRAREFVIQLCDDWFHLLLIANSPAPEPVPPRTKKEKKAIRKHFDANPPQTAVECDACLGSWFEGVVDERPEVVKAKAVARILERISLRIQKMLIDPAVACMFIQE